jgi:predicted component of type VI protein secretion system
VQVKLKVLTGSHEGKEIGITADKFLIGRSESCQLRPKSESVSRKHCIIVQKDGRLLIQDLKSRNGTFLNEQRLPTDRASVANAGDQLRIGKLMFEIVIEHGLHGNKKPEVTDVGDAAQRTVEAGADDSKAEGVDVSAWLDEADQIDRVKKLSDPDTRQFKFDDSKPASDDDSSVSSEDGDSTEVSVDGSDSSVTKKKREKKKKPGKLPENFRQQMTDNSRDAADDALKRFFSGR